MANGNEKPVVTDELLTDLPSDAANTPDWDIDHSKYQQSVWRNTALALSVEIEKGRNLTEDPQAISDRVLARAAEFYTYLETDNG